MATPTLIVRAHAKINLSLRVGPRRLDGFHELRTVYQAIDLHDTLRMADRKGPFALSCRTPGIPLDTTNLVYKAVEAMWRRLARAGEPRDLSIRLLKRIPSQAGLGGGSSDAAATLVGLNRLWRARLRHDELVTMAATLGSDVPFFLVGGTVLGLGRGEMLQPLPDAPSREVVIVYPPVGIATADAYGWFDADARAAAAATWVDTAASRVRRTDPIVNDLEAPVERRQPVIGAARRALVAAGALAAGMTGSGSAVFGLFETRRAAGGAARALTRAGWTVFATRTLTRTNYERRVKPVPRARAVAR